MKTFFEWLDKNNMLEGLNDFDHMSHDNRRNQMSSIDNGSDNEDYENEQIQADKYIDDLSDPSKKEDALNGLITLIKHSVNSSVLFSHVKSSSRIEQEDLRRIQIEVPSTRKYDRTKAF